MAHSHYVRTFISISFEFYHVSHENWCGYKIQVINFLEANKMYKLNTDKIHHIALVLVIATRFSVLFKRSSLTRWTSFEFIFSTCRNLWSVFLCFFYIYNFYFLIKTKWRTRSWLRITMQRLLSFKVKTIWTSPGFNHHIIIALTRVVCKFVAGYVLCIVCILAI